jgi:hypothetical protein
LHFSSYWNTRGGNRRLRHAGGTACCAKLLKSPAVFAIDLFAEQRLAETTDQRLQTLLARGERILDSHPLAPVAHQSGTPQIGQVPGKKGLGETQQGLEFADAEGSLQEQVQNAEPVRFGQRFEELMEWLHDVLRLYAYAHIIPKAPAICQVSCKFLIINGIK